MKKIIMVIVAVTFCFTMVGIAGAAEPVQKAIQQTTKPPIPIPLGQCSVSGTVKLDPNDKTNGYMHYKGPVTFKALQNLKGTNIYFSGPYSCTCLKCPKHSSHATGLSPEGTFQANESKTYNLDCASWQQPTSGPQGKARIEYFIMTSPPGGVFKWSDCSGKFNFVQ